MAESYLIDTSAVIKYLNGSLTEFGSAYIDDVVEDNYKISFITQIELQVWDPPNKQDLAVYQIFVSQSDIIGINELLIQETIRIRRTYRLKLPDALIAATAIVYDLTLVADNNKDFLKVLGLKYYNPNK